MISGVSPSLLGASTLAPDARRAASIFGLGSGSAAQSMSGVHPSLSRSFTSAPASRRASMTPGFLFLAAYSAGDLRKMSRAARSAPAFSRIAVTSGFGFPSAAFIRGVVPSRFRALTSAPRAKAARTSCGDPDRANRGRSHRPPAAGRRRRRSRPIGEPETASDGSDSYPWRLQSYPNNIAMASTIDLAVLHSYSAD